MRKAWAWPPASLLIATATSTSATAAEPSSRSGATGRFSSSPPSSPASRHTTWRLTTPATFTSRGPPPPVTTLSIRSIPTGTSTSTIVALGAPQGLAFDAAGNLYVAASLNGRRGIVKITPDRKASLVVSGQNLVGLAFAPGKAVVLATSIGVHHLDWGIAGRDLVPAR